MIKNTVLQ